MCPSRLRIAVCALPAAFALSVCPACEGHRHAIAPGAATPPESAAGGDEAGPGEGWSSEFTARLLDIEPAVRWTGDRHAMAVLRRERAPGGVRRYVLVDGKDRRGVLEIVTDDWEGDALAMRSFGARASVGLFGDARLERRLVEDVSRRAEKLSRRKR